MSREFVSFEDVILIADFGRTRDDPAMRHVFFFTALFPLLSATAAPVKFETEILPFLEKKCVECHSAPHADKNGKIIKPKAGLRMDAAWAIKAGSEDGAVLVAGKPPESELFLRVTLPTDDDDFMPPSGKADPLTPEETELFKRWIEEGADFGDWHGNLEGKPATVSNTGDVVPTSEIQEVYKRLATGLTLPRGKKLGIRHRRRRSRHSARPRQSPTLGRFPTRNDRCRRRADSLRAGHRGEYCPSRSLADQRHG